MLVVDETVTQPGRWALLLQRRRMGARRCRSMSGPVERASGAAHGFYLRNGYEHYKTQKRFGRDCEGKEVRKAGPEFSSEGVAHAVLR